MPHKKSLDDKQLNRKEVLKKDNYDCIKCGKMACMVHHIDLNRSNNRITNVVALCVECHQSIHNYNRQRNKKYLEVNVTTWFHEWTES